jgi:hypothetical protein
MPALDLALGSNNRVHADKTRKTLDWLPSRPSLEKSFEGMEQMTHPQRPAFRQFLSAARISAIGQRPA